MWKKFIFLAFLFNGLCILFAKVLTESGLGGFNLFYLFIFYAGSVIWASALCFKQRIIPTKKDVLIGLGAGLSDYLGSVFMMIALNKTPGTIVFPIAIGGNLITVAFFATLIFKEKLGIKGILGIIGGTIGLILISI